MPRNSLEDIQQSLLDNVPPICRTCPKLGTCALMYAMLDNSRSLTGANKITIEHEIITQTGDNNCSSGPIDGECGSVKSLIQ